MSSRIPSLVTHIYVPIPDNTMILSTSVKESYQFSSNQTVTFDHSTAVGSGQLKYLML